MKRIAWLAIASCIVGGAAAAAAVAPAGERSAPPALTVAAIVAKNVEARGGLAAWRKVETMTWTGRIETEKAPPTGLPFMLEMKRTTKTRFEMRGPSGQTVRAFDGKDGWKMRMERSGKPQLQAFTPDELTFAKDGEGLDGLLIDCEAKGIQIALEGQDTVEGSKAYRLRATLLSGAVRHVWVDAKTLLEIRVDRVARNPAGMSGTVSVRYRNYQTIEGLRIPMVIETGPANAKAMSAKSTDKMVIERVILNPPIEDRRFTGPRVPGSNVVTIAPPPPRTVLPQNRAPGAPAGSPAPATPSANPTNQSEPTPGSGSPQ